jgi:hypothetical protein
VRLLRSRQRIPLLARKVAAVGFIALLLLPAFSTAEDFHTWALHRVSSTSHLTQLGDQSSDKRSYQDACFACHWQSITDTAGVIDPFHIDLALLYLLTVGQSTTEQVQLRTIHPRRAPPLAFSS